MLGFREFLFVLFEKRFCESVVYSWRDDIIVKIMAKIVGGEKRYEY